MQEAVGERPVWTPNPNEALYFFGLGVAEAVSGGTSTRITQATPGKAQELTWRYGMLTATTLRARTARRGRSGGAAGDCRPAHN